MPSVNCWHIWKFTSMFATPVVGISRCTRCRRVADEMDWRRGQWALTLKRPAHSETLAQAGRRASARGETR